MDTFLEEEETATRSQIVSSTNQVPDEQKSIRPKTLIPTRYGVAALGLKKKHSISEETQDSNKVKRTLSAETKDLLGLKILALRQDSNTITKTKFHGLY